MIFREFHEFGKINSQEILFLQKLLREKISAFNILALFPNSSCFLDGNHNHNDIFLPLCFTGEDPQFDQLLSSLSSVAEHCLSSLLKTLFLWYERQKAQNQDENGQKSPGRTRSGGGHESPKPPNSRTSFHERDLLYQRRDMAVEFIFCLVLIEVLKQLSLHPVSSKINKRNHNLT